MPEWHCSECGCSFDEAQVKRRRRGEPPIRTATVAVCTEACAKARRARTKLAWQQKRRAYLAKLRKRLLVRRRTRAR